MDVVKWPHYVTLIVQNLMHYSMAAVLEQWEVQATVEM